MVAYHRCRITILIHPDQRLHHLARTFRGDERIERQLGTIDIPHGEIIISDFLPHIAHLVRQEGTAIQSAVKLVDLCLITMFHIDGMQAVAP